MKDMRLEHLSKDATQGTGVLAKVSGFFSAVPGSLKGHLNTTELLRIAITALTAGGGILGILQMVLQNVGMIFPAPSDAALAGAVLTILIESLRRLNHGGSPSTTLAIPTQPRSR